jgi:hypothetical protein
VRGKESLVRIFCKEMITKLFHHETERQKMGERTDVTQVRHIIALHFSIVREQI